MVKLTMSFYRHAITGTVASYSDRFAAVFGDRLVKVDGPEPDANESPRPKKTTRKTSDDTTTDSSKEGNA